MTPQENNGDEGLNMADGISKSLVVCKLCLNKMRILIGSDSKQHQRSFLHFKNKVNGRQPTHYKGKEPTEQ